MALKSFLRRKYDRNILIREIGIEGQEKLIRARVLIIGAGGLGSSASLYCASAGVGTIGIADSDTVELSNLQRQILHTSSDIGRAKTDSAGEKLEALNPDIKIIKHRCRVEKEMIRPLISQYDFIIDASDNFETKFLVNDACVREGINFSHGAVHCLSGQTITVLPGESACFRCIFGSVPPKDSVSTTAQEGILGSVAGLLGTIQATECIKAICGIGTLLTDCLLTFDAISMNFRKIPVKRDAECEACGKKIAG